ncbi:MAG: hypothetical protein U1E65_00435 [Myxococcota bacterium]
MLTAVLLSALLVGAPCSDPGGADCTLKDWMKINLEQNLERRDFGRLAWALRRLADATRRSKPDWFELARDAAIAAERKDEAKVKAQCEACHEAYRRSRR